MASPADTLAQTLPSAVAAAPVPDVGERYEVRRELARGGQAQVFVAFDRQLGREVALKLPLPGKDGKVSPDVEARFLREARITARLDHPNIVTVHEIGRASDQRMFCAQRLVRGDGTLSAAIHGATHTAARLALLPRILDVANAVAFAHKEGVVHRDLKPDNVVVGALGETVVLDWGLGRVLSDADPAFDSLPGAETLDGQPFGTPLYMSPEQARGERAKVGTASDVWSIGVMLFELLSGLPPFVGATLLQVLDQVRSAPVPKLHGEVPRALAAIVARALERDPAKRYPHAGALADDLRRFLDNRTVGAHAYSATELVGLFVRRQRAATAVGAVSFLILLIGVVALARAVRQNRESLAEAFVEKGRLAEGGLRWEEAAFWYASARDLSPREDAAAGLRFVWPRTQKAGSRLLFGHSGAIKALVSAPDGATLYSGSADHSIRAWNIATGLATRVLEGHALSVNALAISADGATLYSGGEDDQVLKWDLRTGASAALAKLPDAVNALTVSPDGKTLAIGGEDGRVLLVELAGSGVPREFARHEHPVYAVAFSPDGAHVASGSWDGLIQVRARETGDRVAELRGHAGSVLALAFDPKGKLLASAGRDTTVRLWAVDGWHEQQSVVGNTQKAYAVAWSDSGDVVASAGADGTSRVWAGYDTRPMPSSSVGRDDELLSTTFLHGSKLLATGGRRGVIALRLIEAGSPQVTNFHDVTSLSELDDGRIALQHRIGFALVTPDLKRATIFPPPDAPDAELAPARAVIANRSGSLAFGTANDATARFYDVTRSRSIAAVGIHTGYVEQCALSPDEALLATAGKDGRVLVWNVATHDLRVALPISRDGVFGVAFSPNGRWLASAGYDRLVRVYDTTTWQEVLTLKGHDHGVRAVRFSPDSKLLATAGWDRSVRLWRTDDGAPAGVLFGHQDQIMGLDFSPDGRRLASGSYDGTIRIWDVARLTEVVRFTADEGRVNSVLYSRDGTCLYYVRHDLHRINLADVDLPESLDAVKQKTALEMKGLKLVWTPVPSP